MDRKEIGGEYYYKAESIKSFIQQCNEKNTAIFSIEFFRIIDGKVIPFSKLQGIDSTGLYDKSKSKEENISVCNGFIDACIKQCYNDIIGLYFNATLEE